TRRPAARRALHPHLGRAINGRLEHLRGIALGFRNEVHYRLRSLLETGGFRPRLHPGS
ncbi:MAG: ISL3 family transposase, partial [Acidipropionibacterium jensenii]|nr:ISL3 family transposase [Acidipropionibacterium jensenii]